MNEQRIEEILTSYEQVIMNTREALHLAGMPQYMIPIRMIYLPPLEGMLPADVVSLFKTVRYHVISYLHAIGFSHREIVRRVGGDSLSIVQHIIALIEKEKKDVREKGINLGLTEEVMKDEDQSSIEGK